MINKVPFNERLISIGNSPHFNGQLVWSDGRIAYGWVYNQANAIPVGSSALPGGIFVADFDWDWTTTPVTVKFRLMNEDLSLTGYDYIYTGPGPYNNFSLPWQARDITPDQTGLVCMLDSENYYTFDGMILAFENGNMLTYFKGYEEGTVVHKLYHYNNSGIKVATTDITSLLQSFEWSSGYFCAVDVFGGEEWFLESFNNYNYPLFALATPSSCYLTLKEQNHILPRTFKLQLGSVIESQIPQTWEVSENTTLNLSDMSLTVGGTTFSNDPLGLLEDVEYPVFPASVKSYNDMIFLHKIGSSAGGYHAFVWRDGFEKEEVSSGLWDLKWIGGDWNV